MNFFTFLEMFSLISVHINLFSLSWKKKKYIHRIKFQFPVEAGWGHNYAMPSVIPNYAPLSNIVHVGIYLKFPNQFHYFIRILFLFCGCLMEFVV